MSHEVETMAWANEVPWHGLGARVDGDISVDEMLVAAGLDWEVTRRPMIAKWEDETGGHEVPVRDRFALVRSSDHRVLTVTGKSWNPIQNRDTLGFMRNYVEAGGATLETAGSLRGGKIVWGLAKLKHSFEVTKNDRVEGYLLITSPHEVGRAMSIRTTTVRVVCANTMAMAMAASEVNYSQNHLTEFNVAAAKEAIGEAHEALAAAEGRAKALAGLKISMEDAVRKVLLPIFTETKDLPEETLKEIMETRNQPKRLQGVIESILTAPGHDEGTGWGVLNGVTHYIDHVAGRNADTRMFRAWVGDFSRIKLDAESRLLELV